MRMLSRRLALLTLGALTLSGTACGDDEPSGGSGGIGGTYTLRTVNSQNVPMTLYEVTEGSSYSRLEVLGGRVTLGAGDRFELVRTTRSTVDANVRAPRELLSSGTYTRDGNTLSLRDVEQEFSYTMTVQSDGSLVETGMLDVPISARYVKQ